ncbi:MAG: RelA/SpoT family protein [Ktedonobacterales bacterium]
MSNGSQAKTTGEEVGGSRAISAISAAEVRLLSAVEQYLRPPDVEHVRRVLAYARELRERLRSAPATPAAASAGAGAGGKPSPVATQQPLPDVDYVIGVALTLAEYIHIDAISLAAVLLYQAIESGLATLDDVRARLSAPFGDDVAQTIANIERFDTLQRPGAALRRSAQVAESDGEEPSRDRRRSRERQRRQDAESLRKMFVAMTEDPRVAVFKIADQLRLMRLAREAADAWRGRDGRSTSRNAAGDAPSAAALPALAADECRLLAEETREIYAPLAGRLGMGRVEGEMEDLAFAILQPDEYRWLAAAVRGYAEERGSYVERVQRKLEAELSGIGLRAEVSGRIKHLASIYKKVERTGSRDLSTLYDIIAFRIIVPTVEDCYLALGQVHALWQPRDGRIKDFIANPKANGYQSLHTTVFCLDDRLAEFQIRTPQMHELAEYGVAMHWYYKAVGDSATADATSLQSWVQQLKEWQQELQGAGSGSHALDMVMLVKGDVLKEQIFVFTPAGDVKELPAGSTPIDFAYLIHTDVGNSVAGARVSAQDAGGRLVKKLVPLDYELKNGDVIEIMRRKEAHPTRDWLNVARTKTARDRIHRYLKAHERDIDLQLGRERLDRELRVLGLRKGFDDLSDDDLAWLVATFEQHDAESLLVAVGGDKLRLSVVVARLRERLLPPEPAPEVPDEVAPPRDAEVDASVAGLEGMLTRLAACCDPIPGDELMGYITRGKGVVIHRADCSNLAHLLAQEPERAIPVALARLRDRQNFRAPIVIEALDRTGLLADVTGVITGMKINMLKVNTATHPRQHRAVITATLEIQRPEQLSAVIKQLEQVQSVHTVGRKRVHHDAAAAGGSGSGGGHGRTEGKQRH